MKGQKLHARTWPALLAAVVLVAAHAALFGVAFPSHASVALVGVVVVVFAVKAAWWRFRR